MKLISLSITPAQKSKLRKRKAKEKQGHTVKAARVKAEQLAPHTSLFSTPNTKKHVEEGGDVNGTNGYLPETTTCRRRGTRGKPPYGAHYHYYSTNIHTNFHTTNTKMAHDHHITRSTLAECRRVALHRNIPIHKRKQMGRALHTRPH